MIKFKSTSPMGSDCTKAYDVETDCKTIGEFVNEDKAKELAKQLLADDQNQQPLIDVLLQMAHWKEKQLKEVCKRCEQHIIDSGRCGCAYRSLSKEYCWED